jgi:hypothetical protein
MLIAAQIFVVSVRQPFLSNVAEMTAHSHLALMRITWIPPQVLFSSLLLPVLPSPVQSIHSDATPLVLQALALARELVLEAGLGALQLQLEFLLGRP